MKLKKIQIVNDSQLKICQIVFIECNATEAASINHVLTKIWASATFEYQKLEISKNNFQVILILKHYNLFNLFNIINFLKKLNFNENTIKAHISKEQFILLNQGNVLNTLPLDMQNILALSLTISDLKNLCLVDKKRYNFFSNYIPSKPVIKFFKYLGSDFEIAKFDDNSLKKYVTEIISIIDANSPFFNLSLAESVLDQCFNLNFSYQLFNDKNLIYEIKNGNILLKDSFIIGNSHPGLLLASIDISILNYMKQPCYFHKWYQSKIKICVINYLINYHEDILPLLFRLSALHAIDEEEITIFLKDIKSHLQKMLKEKIIYEFLNIIFCEKFINLPLSSNQEFYYPTISSSYNSSKDWLANLSSLEELNKIKIRLKKIKHDCQNIIKTILSNATNILLYPHYISHFVMSINKCLNEQHKNNQPLTPDKIEFIFFTSNWASFKGFTISQQFENYWLSRHYLNAVSKEIYQNLQESFVKKTINFLDLETIKTGFNRLIIIEKEVRKFQNFINNFLLEISSFNNIFKKFSKNVLFYKNYGINYLEIIFFHKNIMNFILEGTNNLNPQSIKTKICHSYLCWGVYCLLNNFHAKGKNIKTTNYLLANLIYNSNLADLEDFISFLKNRDNPYQEIFILAQLKIEINYSITWQDLKTRLEKVKKLSLFFNSNKDINIHSQFMAAIFIEFFEEKEDFFNKQKIQEIIKNKFDIFFKLIVLIQHERKFENNFHEYIKFLAIFPDHLPTGILSTSDIHALFKSWQKEQNFTEQLIVILTTWSMVKISNPNAEVLDFHQLIDTMLQIKDKENLKLFSSLSLKEANLYYNLMPTKPATFKDLLGNLNKELIENAKQQLKDNSLTTVTGKRNRETESNSDEESAKVSKMR